MERVIVPVDFSEESIMSLQRAIFLANSIGLHVRMVHVKKEMLFSNLFGNDSTTKLSDKLVVEYLEILKNKYISTYKAKGIFDYVLRHGAINEELQKQGSEDKAYFYFLGLQGASTIKDFLVGGNAYRLLSSTTIPIITSRKSMPIKAFRKILMPLELKTDTRIKIPWVAALARALGATVHIWGYTDCDEPDIIQKVNNYVKQAEEYLDKIGVSYCSVQYANEDYQTSILKYIDDNKIDLVSLMTDINDDPIERLSGSHERKMLNESPIPILCIPPVLQ